MLPNPDDPIFHVLGPSQQKEEIGSNTRQRTAPGHTQTRSFWAA